MSKSLITKAYVEKMDEEKGVLEVAIASDGLLDREGEAISQDGWVFNHFQKNPVFLWGHNAREYRPPIGKVEKLWFEGEGKDKKLMFKPKFDLKDDFAKKIWRKFKDGFLNAFSVGFIPLEREGDVYTKAELIEISAVAVPANPRAIVALRGMGMKSIEWDELLDANKGVLPFKSTEPSPESTEWNEQKALTRVKEWAEDDTDRYKSAFVYVGKDDDPTTYKLPHHDVYGGNIVVNWRAVARSMALLLGVNGTVDIPEDERKEAYDHLKKHYKQFEKPAPEFRDVQDQVLSKYQEEIRYSVGDDTTRLVLETLRSIRGEIRASKTVKQVPPVKKPKRVKKIRFITRGVN